MKKQITYLIISLAVVLIGAVFYIGVLQKEAKKSLLERIPVSKPHSHVSPAGDVVEHTHAPIRPPTVKPKKNNPLHSDTKHSILRIWENLDLAAIKRDYQPYTVPEIIEKWHEGYMNFERPNRNQKSRNRFERLEAYWPREEWLQHLMDNGFPFSRPVHYTFAFNSRDQALMAKDKYDNPETRAELLEGSRLPIDTTWEEMEDFGIKFDIVSHLNLQRATDVDPSVYGGVTNLDGVFTPFSPNKVYVHVSEDNRLSTFKGAKLSKQQQYDLTMFGVAPKGITVVYTDEKGVPLAADAVPRFYERQMAALEVAESYIEQLIADHNIPPEMLPSEPLSRANRQQWFEVLQELHGGELPKDLRALQAAIHELEDIQQAATEKQQATR